MVGGQPVIRWPPFGRLRLPRPPGLAGRLSRWKPGPAAGVQGVRNGCLRGYGHKRRVRAVLRNRLPLFPGPAACSNRAQPPRLSRKGLGEGAHCYRPPPGLRRWPPPRGSRGRAQAAQGTVMARQGPCVGRRSSGLLSGHCPRLVLAPRKPVRQPEPLSRIVEEGAADSRNGLLQQAPCCRVQKPSRRNQPRPQTLPACVRYGSNKGHHPQELDQLQPSSSPQKGSIQITAPCRWCVVFCQGRFGRSLRPSSRSSPSVPWVYWQQQGSGPSGPARRQLQISAPGCCGQEDGAAPADWAVGAAAGNREGRVRSGNARGTWAQPPVASGRLAPTRSWRRCCATGPHPSSPLGLQAPRSQTTGPVRQPSRLQAWSGEQLAASR